MKVDYNSISKVYDDVRESDIDSINCFLDNIVITDGFQILDIGCGTGNYTSLVQKITRAKVYGMDQSEGMLEKAKNKNSEVSFFIGDAMNIPMESDKFDFVYMTDVIHHVEDIEKMFFEISRILKKGGKVCIATQSHLQIEQRPTAFYFPATAEVDKKRYPDIDKIVSAAAKNGFTFLQNDIIEHKEDFIVDKKYLELVEKKGYSMFHLIPEEDYNEGLQKVKEDFSKGNIKHKFAGESLVWFIK